MIVQESDALLAALDRRMQVERVLALDPVAPVAGSRGEAATPTDQTSSHAVGPATATVVPAGEQDTLSARLPLGRVVPARVVDVGFDAHGDERVTADVERWRVALAWPRGAGPAPRPGQDIALRVLAHKPMLLFQSVGESLDGPASSDVVGAPVRWSREALALAGRPGLVDGATGDGPSTPAGAQRFTAPILEIAFVAGDDEPSVASPPADAADRATSRPLAASPAGAPMSGNPTHDRIALDDVIVGATVARPRDATPVVGAPPRDRDDPTSDPTMPLPVVLQGPAWPGQPMELVVRRDRDDDAFDNPALDQWCGEIVIELPALGRIAGHLAWSMQGLRIRLDGHDAAAVASMTAATTELAAALVDADLRVVGLTVGGGPS